MSLLRRLVGEPPPIEPIATEEQAWQELSAALARPLRRRSAPWLLLAMGAVPAMAVLAALLLPRGPHPSAPAAAVQDASAAKASVASTGLPPAAKPEENARVEALGAALSVSDGQRATVVHGGFELLEGMGVATSRGEARIRLPGGSLALLEPDSALGVARLEPDGVVLALASGAIFVHAAKLGGGSLVVRAGDSRVVVHGTGFRVERRGGQVSVGLWHGSVEVRSDFDSRGVFLSPGRRLRFDETKGPAGAVARPLGEAEAPGAAEEARLLGAVVPPPPRVPAARRAAPSTPPKAEVPAGPPPFITADVARCRSRTRTAGSDGLRLDLTLADDGQVQAAQAERSGDPKLGSCVAEAALHWKLDPPPQALRGMQFVYPIK